MSDHTLKVRFSRRMQGIQFLFGIIWMLVGVLSLIFSAGLRWTYLLFCVLSLVYLCMGLRYRYQPYVRLFPNRIEEIRIRPKFFYFDQVLEAKTFAGDLILNTSEKTMRINLKLMEGSDRETLLKMLSKRLPQGQFAS